MIRKFFGTVALGSLFVGGLAASHLAFAQPEGPGGARGMRGGPMMMADANKDGTITKAELTAALDARFAKMDVNKDGKLTKEDREQARAQRLDARFARLDADNSGQISKAEFTAAANARQDGASAGKRWGARRHGGRPMGMMGTRQAMADGTVTRDEFMARPLAMFDKADANHDGSVTADEMKTARDAMRSQWQNRKAEKPVS
ncbi:EF-hand domain-containing protein [Sphingobium ummariense]|uniref:EF-hand domain-containing protein n=1 Tax=Sphingobium ummariense RL-3 TaxID=1346791 RepID=T0KF01_9SPHN|nr:EF-hand domain-containing protein [Sphingobium ummariense]EQB31998.1 hypothetical protein M529_11675 [Sphingobium ummariense RL-3]